MVLHMPPDAPSVLAKIINRSGRLPAVPAVHGDRLEGGKIFVAVPARHLLVLDNKVVLSDGPTENGHRPAINALFRSVALAYGQRAVGIVLSGVLDDGVLGSAAIQSRGGITIAQHPGNAVFPTLPRNAVNAGVIDNQMAAAEMGDFLEQLADRMPVEREVPHDASLEVENRMAMGGRFFTDLDVGDLGPPTAYSCPDCNGELVAVGEKGFRCWVGHGWSGDALLSAADGEVERALAVAVRSLQEKVQLVRRLAEAAGAGPLAERYRERAREAEHAVSVLAGHLVEIYRAWGESGEAG